VNVPRFRITWLMVLVALAALNFGAIRFWYQLRFDGNAVNNWVEVLTCGTLPMSNFLAFSIVVSLRRPETCPFLWGFEAFGATALAFFVLLAYVYTEELIQPYVLWVLRLRSIQRTVNNFSPVVRVPIFYTIATLLVGLPQLAFAIIGGLLSRKISLLKGR
jgi:hypothetical protein